MKHNTLKRKQRGFFDFGIGLGLLALLGGTAAVIDQDTREQTEIVQQQSAPAVQVSQIVKESE